MPNNWADALFNRSLDVFAKIVPGLLLLGALFISLPKVWDGAPDSITDLPWGAWVAAFAVAWVTGFSVQSLGERCRIIRYFPNTFTVEEWYQKTVEFRKRQDYDRHKDVFNRLSLIKEACGNTYLALIIATIICAFTKCTISGEICLPVAKVPFFGLIIFEIIIIAALCAMHFRHVDRQYKYMKAVLEAPDSPGPNSPKS